MPYRINGHGAILFSGLSLIVVCLLTASVALAADPAASGAAAKGPLFGREVIVDNQRITGEPSLSIDGQDRIYVSTPYGFSTTASFVWRSIDHGMSFHLVPGNAPPVGKPLVTCVGGGDSQAWPSTPSAASTLSTCKGLTDVSNSVSSRPGLSLVNDLQRSQRYWRGPPVDSRIRRSAIRRRTLPDRRRS